MTFEKYIKDWWEDQISQYEELKDGMACLEELLDKLNIDKDCVGDEPLPDFLRGVYYRKVYADLLSENQMFNEDMLREVCCEIGYDKYSFAEDFICDMAYHICNYEQPEGFFEDLQNSGCISGMIGMFIYHDDCKRFYIKHIDAMEDFVMELEDEFGEPVKNRDRQPRYTFVCWLCYEEFAYRIARELFPNNF